MAIACALAVLYKRLGGAYFRSFASAKRSLILPVCHTPDETQATNGSGYFRAAREREPAVRRRTQEIKNRLCLRIGGLI